MAGVCKINITESEADLKRMLREQKTALGKERVQLLYLLKSQQAESAERAASVLGRHRVTIQTWLRRYRQGGLKGLLEPQVEHRVSRNGHTMPLVSQHFHDSVLILQLDQAGCHRAKRLQIPPSIILMFQPSHAPETNPIERVWLHLKQGLR
jgi:hypothetical protein